ADLPARDGDDTEEDAVLGERDGVNANVADDRGPDDRRDRVCDVTALVADGVKGSARLVTGLAMQPRARRIDDAVADVQANRVEAALVDAHEDRADDAVVDPDAGIGVVDVEA